MSDASRRAILKVSAEFLMDALHLPPSVDFIEARVNLDDATIEFKICDNGLKFIPPGYQIPYVTPQFKSNPASVEFLGWGQKP